MMNMIRADLYRIAHSKAVYAGIAVMLLLIGVSIYGVSPGYIGMNVAMTGDYGESATTDAIRDMDLNELQEMSIAKLREIMLDIEGYELDRDILGSNMNLYYVFIFIVSAIVVADFSQKTAKNTLSSAISRNRYFLSKLVTANLCCVALFLLNTYLIYFSNIIFNNSNLASSLWTVTKISILQLPPILALVSILTGLGFMLKRSAFFNAIAIPLAMVFQLVLSMVIRLFDVIPEKWLNYEFQNMLRMLVNSPSNSYLVRSYLLCGGVIVVFYLAGYLVFKKSEIK